MTIIEEDIKDEDDEGEIYLEGELVVVLDELKIPRKKFRVLQEG